LQTVVLFLGIGIFAVVAYGDVRTRRIPNEFAIAIGVLGLARMILASDLIAALYTIAAGAAVFAVAFLLFWRGVFGGGDAKLLTAAVLLVGYRELADFLLVMGFCGVLVALAVVAREKLGALLQRIPLLLSVCGAPLRLAVATQEGLDHWLWFVVRPAAGASGGETEIGTPARPSVPYGVAIAAAGVLTLVFQS